MKSKAVIVILFLAALGGILFFNAQRRGSSGSGSGDSGPVTKDAQPDAVEISMLYSTEKEEWLKAAAAGFQKENPSIRLNLVGKGSLDAANLILDGKEKPTVWSPADSLVLNLFASDWQTRNGSSPFATSGDDAPQPLVITPLVFAVWEDRAEVLQKASGGAISWHSLQKAIASNQGWPAIGGRAEWGFVKLGHTSPVASNSGLQALLLMSLEYFGKSAGLTVADVLDPKYQAWIADIERGVSKFETSTGTFMVDMVRFGPSKYDIAVIYENLAIAQLANAQGRWGSLKVYYPAVTLWSDHPVALMSTEVTPDQQAAARKWIAWLRSQPVQESALRFGFRPADPSVPIKTGAADNPFTRLAPYGIKIEIPPVATPPEGPVLRNLQTMWTRVVKPH